MMNSPVSYMGNDPIRDQLREWAVRGRYLKEDQPLLSENLSYGPFPLAEVIEVNPSDFDEDREGFDFN